MDTFPSSYGPLDDILAQHSSTFHVLKCGHTVTSQNLSDCGKNCAFPLPVERKDFSYGCRACISRSDRKLIHAVKVVGGAIFDHDPIQNPNAEGEDDLVSLHDTTLSNSQVRNLNDKLAGRKVFVAYFPPSTDKLQHPKITWAMMLDSSWQRLQAEMRTNFQLFNEPLTMEQAARRLRARVEQVGSSGQTINRPLQATPTTGPRKRKRTVGRTARKQILGTPQSPAILAIAVIAVTTRRIPTAAIAVTPDPLMIRVPKTRSLTLAPVRLGTLDITAAIRE
ncbi:MAG: hypothetical protein MMC23_002022 [Stictis urceolatum]|nr:hypothetical protein [Stictis urceolata]